MHRLAIAREVVGHEVKTAYQMQWLTVRNGELLAGAVAASFDVFVTVDRNLSFQQHPPDVDLAVIVMHARTNRLVDLRPLIPQLLQAISTAPRRSVTIVAEASAT